MLGKVFRQQLDMHGTAVGHRVRFPAIGDDDTRHNFHGQIGRIFDRPACRDQSVTHGLAYWTGHHKFHMALVAENRVSNYCKRGHIA